MKTVAYTTIALIAFAANSVLCRLALSEGAIDAASFTVVRLLSGIAMFIVILAFKSKPSTETKKGSWQSAFMLFIYAVTFSYAYVSLDTGTGALVLFGAVQITMIMVSVLTGSRLHASEWLGIFVAFIGLAYLVLPTLTTPSVFGFILMAISGIAWGMYTLNGRGSTNPLGDTASNFKKTAPMVIVLALVAIQTIDITPQGAMLAVLSGALASAIGYTIWYMALGGLSATVAAVVQLSVPVIAAAGGVLFVDEAITLRLMISSLLILGGILVVVLGRYYFARK